MFGPDELTEVSSKDMGDFDSPTEGHSVATIYGIPNDLDQAFDNVGGNVETIEIDGKFEPFFK
jgi:hypothetical protein